MSSKKIAAFIESIIFAALIGFGFVVLTENLRAAAYIASAFGVMLYSLLSLLCDIDAKLKNFWKSK